jgi:hypothetical protein
MKKLMMLVFICASIFTHNQIYASANVNWPGRKSVNSAKTHAVMKSHSKVNSSARKNNRLHGYNYYRYANKHAYLKYMSKAINGR